MSKKLIALLLFLTFSLATHAQQLGILRGSVTDESGALVPGAKVTISNAAGPVATTDPIPSPDLRPASTP
jgi:hypothetical protein